MSKVNKEKVYKSQIETPTESFVERYPWAGVMAVEQQKLWWFGTELGVEADEADFRYKMTAQDRHATLYAQSILTKYEGLIGGETFWSSRIPSLFPRPEIQRMSLCFANVELGSHAEFYKIANEVLGVADDEFYYKWLQDKELRNRIKYVVKASKSTNPLLVTAALAFLEGAVLFSLFAFFKSFNANGNNLIPHFVSGVDASSKDEDFHSLASAALFITCKKERKENGYLSDSQEKYLKSQVKKMAKSVYEHELHLIDNMFSEGESTVISKQDLIEFLEDRINIVLKRLDCKPLFKRKEGSVSNWFYKQLNSVKVPDFFSSTQVQYTRDWKRKDLKFLTEIQ